VLKGAMLFAIWRDDPHFLTHKVSHYFLVQQIEMASQGLRIYWRWRSRRSGRPKTNAETCDLIRRMSSANPF
jgi:hypothetical protein